MAKKKAKSPAGPESVSDAIQRDMAASALRKRAAGKVPNNQEIAALKAVERDEEERRRWEHYRTIPQKHWREMSGRQSRTINGQAERYGIPFGGAKIDLPAVVKALHDFLARNARILSRGDIDGDPLLAGSSSPALEEYRRWRAKLAELDVQQRQGELLPREVIHEGLGRIASVLRRAGESLHRQFGAEAHRLLDDALLDAQREIDSLVLNDDVAS